MTTCIKTFFIYTCALVVGLFATTSLRADDEKPVTPEQLPALAKTFVKENFADQKIVLVMHDKGWTSSKYDVTLSDGTEIEFSSGGEWLEIETKGAKALPESVIPAAVLTYLKANHKDAPAKELAKKRYGYKVELRGGLELKFSKEGKFIGYDD
ncbi:MAG: PepSY-like domain-containing protein [Puniceicoccales bacterium]|jgi:hypothetical protein|nr:PepSY-like domain-containing protein [Puniceicoccales bacterium]